MTLNADIPVFDCWLRREYLYDGEDHHGEYDRCTVFAITSLQGRAIGFSVLLHEAGAVVMRLPISALCAIREAPPAAVDDMELWDCFSYQPSVIEYGHLSGRACLVTLKDRNAYSGRYLFTIDWYGSAYAENAGNSGWKCAHIIELDTGNYAAQPNNRIRWFDPASQPPGWTPAPLDYKVQTTEWQCEYESRWGTGEGMFYDAAKEEEPHEAIP